MEAVSDRPVTFVEDEVIAQGGNEEDERFGYGYYRLKSGWIAQGRADPASVESYKKKGAEPLIEKYGRHVFSPAIIKDRRGNALPQWQPFFQPYDKLLLEAPEEFCLDQILAYHWHRGCYAERVDIHADSTYKIHRLRIVFPQLAGKVFPDFPCVICGRVFNAAPELNKHTRMSHPEQSTILKLAETQEAIATAITAAQGSTNGDSALAAVLQQVMASQAQMSLILESVLNGQNGQRVRGPRVLTEEQKERKRSYDQARRARIAEGEINE